MFRFILNSGVGSDLSEYFNLDGFWNYAAVQRFKCLNGISDL